MSWTHMFSTMSIGTGKYSNRSLNFYLYTKRKDDSTLQAYFEVMTRSSSDVASSCIVTINGTQYSKTLSFSSSTSSYWYYTSPEFSMPALFGELTFTSPSVVINSTSCSITVSSSGFPHTPQVWIDYSLNGIDAQTGTGLTLTIGKANTIAITNSRGVRQSSVAANYRYDFEFFVGNTVTTRTTIDIVSITGNQDSASYTPSASIWSNYSGQTIHLRVHAYYSTLLASLIPMLFQEAPSISAVERTDPSTIFAHIKNPSNVQDAATVGSANTIVISAAEYKYTVQLLRNNTVVATPVSNSTSLSHSYTPPIATWGPYITDALSGTITVRLLMYDGSTLVGSTDTTATMTIPANLVQPACSIATSDDAGYLSTYGGYVLGQSRIKVTATNTLRYGATLASILITANGSNYTYNNCVTDVIASISYTSVTCQITDSRGQTASASVTITILNWFTPIPSVAVHRGTYSGGVFTPDDNGGYVKIDWGITIAPVNNRNSKAGSVSAPDGSHALTLSSYTASGSIISAANTEYSYDITVTATDAFESASRTTRLSTAGVIMDFKSGGKGVAFGKVAETDNMVEISSNWTLKAYNIMIGNQTLAQYIQSIVGS